MKKVITAVTAALVLMCGVLFQGCASLGDNVATEKLMIQYATMKVIEADREAMPERAAKISQIVVSAGSFFDSGTADVALLKAEVIKRLPADLSPADQVLANALIDSVVAELQSRVGNGLVSPDKRLQVQAVLGWIHEATQFYSPREV